MRYRAVPGSAHLRLASLALALLFQFGSRPIFLDTGPAAHAAVAAAAVAVNQTAPLDTECLGDRAEAVEAGRQCSRRCRKDVPCENTRKQCLCDGLCGMSCIKPDLACPDLAPLENGDFAPKGISRFHSRVSYRCHRGHYLFGSRERLCQGDEEWSGTAVECLPGPACRGPPRVAHARYQDSQTGGSTLYELGERVDYTCYPGYAPALAQSARNGAATWARCSLVGDQRIANETGWLWGERASESALRCAPRSCGEPGPVENGRRQGDSFTVASSVVYTCNEGYQLTGGAARRYCQSDARWSGLQPRCEPLVCNPSEHLENGKINYTYPLVFNSTVLYTCDTGYLLEGGPARRRCGPEGRLLGEQPVCREIDCGPTANIPNGQVRGQKSKLGDRREFVCAKNMLFQGRWNASTCQENGRWSGEAPRCLAPCRVPSIEFARVIYRVPGELAAQAAQMDRNHSLDAVLPGSLVEHGTRLALLCSPGFELRGSTGTPQPENQTGLGADPLGAWPACNNGSWTMEPVCRPAACRKSPPSPKNGRVRVHSIEHGALGRIKCLDGFRLAGDNATLCRLGIWTPINSTCREIFCQYPGRIEHGRVLLVGLTGMYDYKPYNKKIGNNRQVAYECEPGYRLAPEGAPSGATCMDGRWRPDGMPDCVRE